ncbi:MAG: DUF2384 domain-containing protein [Deltaproteobacteria bacterium]|nr:DUF2384 domain-containing protein [Deltaproteobacteria bacterium]
MAPTATKRAARPARERSPDRLATGMRAFFRIMDAWGVDNDAARILLGRPSRATFFLWKKGQVRGAPHDTLQRISYVLGIYKALQLLFPSPAQADAWVKKENDLLGGQTALARMCAGDVTDLAAVRALLDAARGGGA